MTTITPPYCFAVSSILNLPPSCNFLATQVWPSARVAARALEACGESILNADDKVAAAATTTTICELGCGPGLPSLTAAAAAASKDWEHLSCRVIATDIDELALDLVMAAAEEQGLQSIISTRIYDLVAAEWDSTWMDDVDLFVMSDVFETQAIAKGAAKLTQHVLDNANSSSTMWVFAQSDRAQRELYLQELQRLYPEDETVWSRGWVSVENYDVNSRLWLCDLDETKVKYG